MGEQPVFAKLVVFRGGFSAAAAHYPTGATLVTVAGQICLYEEIERAVTYLTYAQQQPSTSRENRLTAERLLRVNRQLWLHKTQQGRTIATNLTVTLKLKVGYVHPTTHFDQTR